MKFVEVLAVVDAGCIVGMWMKRSRVATAWWEMIRPQSSPRE